MRRSSTDESTYRRSPSPPGKEPGFARGGPFFGLHANPGPKAAQARYTSPKGNKYVVFYLDLSFIFLLELKRCSMARGCLQGVKYLMFAFNLLFWGLQLGCPETGSQEGAGGQQGHPGEERPRCRPTPRPPPALLRQPGPHGAGTAPLGTQLPSSRRAQVVGRFGPGSLGQRCLPLGGCGILGVGIWLAATQGNFATLSSSFPSLSAANLLIVAGTFVMAIGFVGCIGAIKENKCLLLTLPQVSSTFQMFPSGLGPLGAAGRVWLRPLGRRRKLGCSSSCCCCWCSCWRPPSPSSSSPTLTRRHSRPILGVPRPSPGIGRFSREPGSFIGERVLLGTKIWALSAGSTEPCGL
ncbi:tetraspanin-4 isoform 6-T9 [Megaptera novaeangliae]